MPAKKKKTTKVSVEQNRRITSATGILFAGACVVLIANIQDDERIQLLLIGFGSALLVVGGVLSFVAIQKR